jgi:putative solute:sodium symporter small subunit
MNKKNNSYWKSNLKILAFLMAIWFLASFGFGIIWSDALDEIQIGGFKLGFWFAQQGSIFVFVIIIFAYVYLLNRLDKKHFSDNSEND